MKKKKNFTHGRRSGTGWKLKFADARGVTINSTDNCGGISVIVPEPVITDPLSRRSALFSSLPPENLRVRPAKMVT